MVKIDKEKCIGCVLCSTIAPKTFKPGKDGKAQVIPGDGDDSKKIKEATISCPVGAISNS